MANIKSQIKRIQTNEKARQRNVAVQVRPEDGRPALPHRRRGRGRRGRERAPSRSPPRQLDKAASKGVIHKNQAANRKSGLAKQVAGL